MNEKERDGLWKQDIRLMKISLGFIIVSIIALFPLILFTKAYEAYLCCSVPGIVGLFYFGLALESRIIEYRNDKKKRSS
jgi:hypothetical protein